MIIEQNLTKDKPTETWQEIQKAMKQSLYQEKKAIAIKLIKQGAALDFISKVTYLTKAELQHLLRDLT